MNLHIAKALNDLKDYEQADAILGEAAHSWPFDLLVKINQVGMLQKHCCILSIQNMKTTWCERVKMFCGLNVSGKELGRLGEAYHAPLQGNARRSKGWLFGKDPRCQRCFAEFQMVLPNGKPVNIRHHWTLPKLLLKLHTTLGYIGHMVKFMLLSYTLDEKCRRNQHRGRPSNTACVGLCKHVTRCN